jgi:outer membrane protein insertion porin family
LGGSLGIGRSIGRHTRVGATYSIEDDKVKYELNPNINSLYTTSSITPYINFNNTDDYFIPRSGIVAGTSLKKAGLGGDADYMLSSSYFKYFYSLEDATDMDLIFRYKTSIKVMKDTGEIPNGTSFYLGGVYSVRGYQSYAFQPIDSEHPFKRYFTNTIELSFPLIPSAKMRWAIFYDHGMIGEDKFTQIKKSGRGVVISWYSPVGPLQFIFSRAINPDDSDRISKFEFSLGSKF